MIRRQFTVDRGGQSPGLYRTDAHHADIVDTRCGHDLSWLGRTIEELQPTGGIHQIGETLYSRGLRVLSQDFDDRIRMADARQAPGADQPLGLQSLECRTDMGSE